MNTTKNVRLSPRQKELIKQLSPMIILAGQLSNIAFNLSQNTSGISERDKLSMKDTQRKFDKARNMVPTWLMHNIDWSVYHKEFV